MRRVFFGFLLMGLATPLLAQVDSSTVKSLTFKEAVQIGLKNNFTLRQQNNTLDATQVNRTSSLLQMGPRVDAGGEAGRVDGNSFNQQEGRVVNGQIDYVNGSIGASIPIFGGMGRLNSYRSARNTNDAQLHMVHRTRQDVIQNVVNQYLSCLLDYELVKINRQNIETQQIQYDQIKTQVELGAKAEADLYNQEYQLRNAQLLFHNADNTLKNDLALLAQTLALDPGVPLQLEPVQWEMNEILQDSAVLSDLYTTALSRRSDLKQREFTAKASHYSYSAVKGRIYPTLSGYIQYGSRYNYTHGSTENRSFSDQFTKDNTALTYGVSLTIPIFYGLQTRANAATSRALYKNAELDRESTEVAVKAQVLRAHQNYNNAKTSYLAAQAQLTAAELTYKTQKERYDLGVANIVELNTTNQSYVKAQGDFESAKFTLMFQRLLVDYSTGTITEENIPE